MFEGEKTLVFWAGLLVFGYSLAQFCAAIWDTIYYILIFPRVYKIALSSSVIAGEVFPLVPLIISGVIFAVIGWYMMGKGVKQN